MLLTSLIASRGFEMIFVGIDIGISGGIALLDGNKVKTWVMPACKRAKKRMLNHWQLSLIVSGFDPNHAFAAVENQHAMPHQGVVSTFALGYAFASVIQVLTDYSIPYEVISPRVWQREFGISAKKGDTKKQALEICQKLFPEANLLATTRSRKPHDGIVDALLICEWNRRHYKGQLKNR